MTMAAGTVTVGQPLDLVLSRLDGVRQVGNRYMARCPAHDDAHPSLSVAEAEGGQVLLRCFAGCRTEDVMGALGLKMSDLFPPRGSAGNAAALGSPPPRANGRKEQPRLTVADLARAKGLPETLLRRYAEDVPDGVLFAYRLQDGSPAPVRRTRTALEGSGRFKWGRGDKPIPFGLDRLPPPKGYLFLVEGETDALTAWAHGLAALGLPGADTAGCLEAAHLEGVQRLFVVQEPDEGGRKFVAGIARRLRELGWQGDARVVTLGEHKDMNALHVALKGDREAFLAAVREAVRQAQPLPPGEEETAGEERPAREIVLTPLSSVERQAVSWLWPGWVPRGRLTLVAGAPGVGKSWLTAAVAAAVTTGAPLPGDEERRDPADVIMLALEDDAADTLRPRLEEMGADLDRVHVFHAVIEREGETVTERGLILPRDAGLLQQAIERTKATLVVVDPLVAVMDAGVDSHRQAAVRQVLAPLHQVAQATGAAIALVAHLRKSASEAAIYRVGGSIDLTAAARTVIVVAPDPEDPAPNPSDRRRVACVAKSNISAFPPPVAFTLKDGRFGWDSAPVAAGMTAEKLLETPPPGSAEQSAVEEAIDFLQQALADGPRPAKEIQREAAEAGISPITLRRAREHLRIRPTKAGMSGGWVWTLPEDDQGAPKTAKLKNLITFADNEDNQAQKVGYPKITRPQNAVVPEGDQATKHMIIFEDAQDDQAQKHDHLRREMIIFGADAPDDIPPPGDEDAPPEEVPSLKNGGFMEVI